MMCLMKNAYLKSGLFIIIYFFAQSVSGQKANYAAAEKYDVQNLKDKVGTPKVIPFFFKGCNKFWFVFEDASGKNYYYVDPEKGEKHPLFDKKFIIQKLTGIRDEKIDSAAITYYPDFAITANQKTVIVGYKSKRYAYNFYEPALTEAAKESPRKTITNFGDTSPDKKWSLYARSHNLYLKKIGDTTQIQLSADARPYYSFSINEGDSTSARNEPSAAVWLADSKHFYVIRKDNRKVKTLSVVHTLFSPRPRIETYKYQLPGDKDVTQYELFIGDINSGKLTKVKADKWPDQELSVVKANDDTSELFFLRKKRTCDEIELCAVNILNGQVRIIINEVSRPYINDDLFNVSIINKGKDIIWWSDRSGWGQYYHYNGDGKLLNAITSGNWTAGRILKTDTAGHTIYFYGYGKEIGRNPYYSHVYRVNFNGGDMKLLTPENAAHDVFFSPDGKYLIDNFSTIQQTPVTVLRNKTGNLICEVARADFKKLFDYGWKTPEPFTVKAKDGVTDLYGLMWKPFDFDPNKKYPIISQVYPGPQIETVWTDFTVFDKYNNAPIAQLGFIVVVMGHRGGSPYRDKKYATYGYGNLRDAPLEDDKYGLKQLAQRYSYIDLKRVGIFGHSGGGMMSTAAICTYPDFYKVAVSSSGNHDNTIYNLKWGETYQGITEVVDSTKKGNDNVSFKFKTTTNQALAKNLKGHLLLVTGEVDQNVHPGNTYRMVDALIKAGKDFDMLVLPEQSHHYEGIYNQYFEHKMRAYFAKYLIEDTN